MAASTRRPRQHRAEVEVVQFAERGPGGRGELADDEPAAGLDPEGRDTILSQLKRYHRETGSTVVLVSHSMEDIAKYADKVLVMNAGKIAMYDDTEKVFARAPELLELGLSVPEVTKIFLRLQEMGLSVQTDVYTVQYAVDAVLRYANARKAGQNTVGGAAHA